MNENHEGPHKSEVLSSSLPVAAMDIGISFIYFLIDKNEIVYVGQTKDLTTRIRSHLESGKQFDRFSFEPCDRYSLSDIEAFYIVVYQPKYNLCLPPNNNFLTLAEISRLLGMTTIDAIRLIQKNGVVPCWGKGRNMYSMREIAEHVL